MNLRRKLWGILTLFLMVLPTFAQNTFQLGYCPDELTDKAQTAVLNVSYDCLFSAAIVIPESRMKLFKGGTIRKVRFAAHEGLTMVKVMLRNELDGPSISGTYTDMPSATVEGWQEVTFNSPYTITGEQLVIMYTGYLPAKQGLLCDGKPHDQGFWVKSNGMTWNKGSDAGYGALCLQAVVEPQGEVTTEDLALLSVKHTSSYYKIGEDARLQVGISNFGLEQATAPSLHYCWETDGGDGEIKDVAVEESSSQTRHSL